MNMPLSIIMDMILLCALAITIVYAIRLSQSLNAFKSQRNEFRALFAELTQHIDKAYSTLDALKNTGDQSAAELQEAVNEARYMLDELQIVNVASENLAKRLERAAGLSDAPPPSRFESTTPDEYEREEKPAKRPKKQAEDLSAKPAKTARSWKDTLKPQPKEAPAKKQAKNDDDGAVFGFKIRDRDYEAAGVTDLANHRSDSGADFASEAEKELYNALSKKKK